MQQSDSISRTNKLFVSSSKPAFLENSIKQLSARAERLRNKIYHNYFATLNSAFHQHFCYKSMFNKLTVRT